MKIHKITSFLESIAPLALQESYDNSGLIIGNPNDEVSKALITLDVTEEIIDEAISKKCQLIISHHPLIFGNISKIRPDNYTGKCIIKAIKNNISIYAIHTNFDNIDNGVNAALCNKIGLINCRILKPKKNILKKLVTFCPTKHADKVRKALFDNGTGHIGNYDSCSYNIEGFGTFRALGNTNPFVGEAFKLHKENEIRIETIFPAYLERNILKALFASHPYEEVAYDIYPLENSFNKAGEGMIGELEKSMTSNDFFKKIKSDLKIPVIRHNNKLNKKIKKVAVCGGSGSFLVKDAIFAGADAFLTSDIKYHNFFDGDNSLIIADIGHYESEQFMKEILYEQLNKKFPTFAVLISKLNTNPVKYY
ncbi:MAG TPA: Nif3-like dinuclear metal center hexameric protein [Bacteroidales bacterium]|nr:Nif3-like dinuclear metal center hexameric protein [Bacteroidales bacterium]HPS16425.1 Nif3-like dinuclear metal center hexameric protein [Bacteroidales bacterium]